MSAIAELFASAINQIAAGTPVWKISIPARFHQDKSLLQVLANQFFLNKEILMRFNQVSSIEDPIERMGILVSAILDPTVQRSVQKPMNPILGEFVKAYADFTNEDGELERYEIETEKIHHHPPCAAYRLSGPNFIVETTEGYETVRGLNIKPNKIDVDYTHALVNMKTPIGVFQWTHPGFRNVGFLYGKKEANLHGEFRLLDPSGYQLELKITMPYKVKGVLYDADMNVVDYLEGDYKDGIYFKNSKKLWYRPVGFIPFEREVPQEVLNHPEYSENVWHHVFKQLRTEKPDFKVADTEKCKVEQAQRELNKTRNYYDSKFGFQLPSHLVINQ